MRGVEITCETAHSAGAVAKGLYIYRQRDILDAITVFQIAAKVATRLGLLPSGIKGFDRRIRWEL